MTRTTTRTRTSCHAAVAVVAVGLLSLPTTSALLGGNRHRTTGTALSMSSFDRGWDNDNFLDSLGSGGGGNDNNAAENNNDNAAIEQANDEYYRQSRYGRPVVADDNNDDGMTTVTDAAAEIYAYSYNKNLGSAPPTSTESSTTNTDAQEIKGDANALSKDMVANIKASHQGDREDSSQGGSRFRALMARAKDQEQSRKAAYGGNYDPTGNAAAAPDTTSATPPSIIMTPEEIANLSIDEQARLYREFFYVQQKEKSGQQNSIGGSKPIGSTASNYLGPGIGFDGRKIGRNKDTLAISNAADVYFAQLKHDSTTRNLARYSGDNSKANEVFHDPAIHDIKAPVNPYLEEQRKRMMDVIETIPEEMLVFKEFDDDDNGPKRNNVDKSFSGVSYRERMAKVQEERRNTNTNQAPGEGNSSNNPPGNPYSY